MCIGVWPCSEASSEPTHPRPVQHTPTIRKYPQPNQTKKAEGEGDFNNAAVKFLRLSRKLHIPILRPDRCATETQTSRTRAPLPLLVPPMCGTHVGAETAQAYKQGKESIVTTHRFNHDHTPVSKELAINPSPQPTSPRQTKKKKKQQLQMKSPLGVLRAPFLQGWRQSSLLSTKTRAGSYLHMTRAADLLKNCFRHP